jgi:hypothetical protein
MESSESVLRVKLKLIGDDSYSLDSGKLAKKSTGPLVDLRKLARRFAFALEKSIIITKLRRCPAQSSGIRLPSGRASGSADL